MKIVTAFLTAIFIAFAGVGAYAIGVDEPLADPAQEDRARELFAEFRCLVCQNQSIEDSQADLAKDLRLLVRERILAGDDDQQIRDFLVERYGDWVLMEPPLRTRTLILWVGPFAFFALAGLVGWRMTRKQPATMQVGSGEQLAPTAKELSADERKELDAILRAQEEGKNG